MIKHFTSIAICAALLSCSDNLTSSKAKALVKDNLVEHGQSDGGSPVDVTGVTIQTLVVDGDKATITYTWSGVVHSPAIAHPRPDEAVKDEAGKLEAVRTTNGWQPAE